MQVLTFWGPLTVAALFLICGNLFAWISLVEGEKRATKISLVVGWITASFYTGLVFLPDWLILTILGLDLTAILVMLCLFFWPMGKARADFFTPSSRIDERDIMFARARLSADTPEYSSYYQLRPEKKQRDDANRRLPGLLSDQASLADPLHFASAEASFFLTESIREAVDGPVSDTCTQLKPENISEFIQSLARYYGAIDTGITELRDYHVYSHIGRGTGTYGSPIHLDHRFAIAFTAEMDVGMMAANPNSQVVMESARQYVACAAIAVQLAQFIRNLGYSARAHIDGNYRVIAPLVARDAGLGEIGRMGLLMTRHQGPRVRIGVVTTSLELVPNSYDPDGSVIDFCQVCTKCAECCPSRSIPFGDRERIDGADRWQIDSESCFDFWCKIGTDCGRCMSVCPYSHPNTWSHNLVRWGIRKSRFFRRCASILDDIFYGEIPISREPDWTKNSDTILAIRQEK